MITLLIASVGPLYSQKSANPPRPATPATAQPSKPQLAKPQPARTLGDVVGTPVETNVPLSLRKGPDGDALASLASGTLLTPLGTENGWTRVRLEGWVPSKDLVDGQAHAGASTTAADLRADPEGNKGKIVNWSVEVLSYQLGDALRRELNGEPYLLARGPGKERAILYLAVPDSLVVAARALPALATVSITARVRSGRSQPAGVPILDLIELFRR